MGPAIDQQTGKASLKAKPMLDSKEDDGSQLQITTAPPTG